MVNELRKTLGRNMRYAQINEQIDNQIKLLQAHASYDIYAQDKIDVLQKQKEANLQHMHQPMSEQEYTEYNDNGQYIGNKKQEEQFILNNNLGQKMLDGTNHVAQGISLGWSDELFGVIGGAGNVLANALMQASGNNLTSETLDEAWNKGYQEYRNFSRQELAKGYQRNPTISVGSEIMGNLLSPITPFKAKNRINMFGNVYHTTQDIAVAGPRMAMANGVIGGIGTTDTNNPFDYAQNVVFNTAGNLIGNKVQNNILGISDRHQVGRKIVEGVNNIGATASNNFVKEWRKKDGK